MAEEICEGVSYMDDEERQMILQKIMYANKEIYFMPEPWHVVSGRLRIVLVGDRPYAVKQRTAAGWCVRTVRDCAVIARCIVTAQIRNVSA